MNSVDSVQMDLKRSRPLSFGAECSLSIVLALSFGALLPLPATAGWTTDGVAVAPTESSQIRPRIVTDDAGGAIIVWEDARGSSLLAYAQRLVEDGSTAPGWPASGVLIPNRGHSQGNLTLIADGA